MDKVYFLKDSRKLKKATNSLLENFCPKDAEVLIKIHFGEPGNKTALFPKDVKPIINVLKFWQLSPVLIDTPVAYPSPRNTVKGYEKVVEEKVRLK